MASIGHFAQSYITNLYDKHKKKKNYQPIGGGGHVPPVPPPPPVVTPLSPMVTLLSIYSSSHGILDADWLLCFVVMV